MAGVGSSQSPGAMATPTPLPSLQATLAAKQNSPMSDYKVRLARFTPASATSGGTTVTPSTTVDQPRSEGNVDLAFSTPREGSAPTGAISPSPGRALGQWEHPELARLVHTRQVQGITSTTIRRFQWNMALLVGLCVIGRTSYYGHVYHFLVHLVGFPPSWIRTVEWLCVLPLLYNIAESVWKFVKPRPSYQNFALSKEQRKLAGIDTQVSSQGATPVSPPQYSRRLFQDQLPTVSSPTTSQQRKEPAVQTPCKTPTTTSTPQPSRVLSPLNTQSPTVASSLRYRPINSWRELDSMLGPDPSAPSGDNQGVSSELSSKGYTPRTTPAGPSMVEPGSPPHLAPLGLYQTATPNSPPHFKDSRKKGKHTGDQGTWLDQYTFCDESQLFYKELQLSPSDVDQLTENMRRWLSAQLLGPLIHTIDLVDEQFNQHGLGKLTCAKFNSLDTTVNPLTVATAMSRPPMSTVAPTPGFVSGGLGNRPTLSTGLGNWGTTNRTNTTSTVPPPLNTPQNLTELSTFYPNDPLVKIRLKLEPYLAIPGGVSRAYIIHRIRTLARGAILAEYQWDQGGPNPSNNKPWNNNLPTDSQLMFHIFCAYMDLITPGVALEVNQGRPFSFKFVVPTEGQPDSGMPFQIKQVEKKPPYFVVLYNSVCYEMVNKRDNLFHTLIAFLLLARQVNSGYLGLLNVNGNGFGMDILLAGTNLEKSSDGF
ncbi:hypothetical protein IWQ62_003160 [Dispira parvispora]|uniref:Transmembrane protein 209 n=1 Tax=Dispira parvispora TaxID=1520584 RepID=A0A9W8AUA1_9FUNG|nr:hypothetical protein IWQ62_003160 [Dispira parvispora]